MIVKTKNFLFFIVIGYFSVFYSHILNAETLFADTTPIHEAFVPKYTDPLPLTFISQSPPKPISESIPPKTYADAIWIPGYWTWLEAKNDFVWICGVWRRPPIDHFWIAGSWHQSAQGWIWAKGFWSNLPLSQLKYIEKAPPTIITDKITPSPGNNYFWAPGYWNYSADSKNYSWLQGKWELANPNWILSPASYIWRPSGFVFVPLHWDWPLESSGTAYACSNNDDKVLTIEPQSIVQKLFYYYPDYAIVYWHWWHFHPDWNWTWNDCDCVPPWWFWNEWWFLGWSDSWSLWWWWTHPGAFPPFWLFLNLSLEIAPPPIIIVDAFKNLPKPPFNSKLGDTPLLPKGTPGKKIVPLPTIPNDVTLGGPITLPPFPGAQITPPTPPPPPIPQPQNEPAYPIQPNYPSQGTLPPTYYPKNDYDNNTPPPSYYPPRDYYPPRHYPPAYYPPNRYPPRDPPHRHPESNHDHGHNDKTPPRTYPTTPKYPKPSDSNYTPPKQTGPNYTPNNQRGGNPSKQSSRYSSSGKNY